MKVVSRRVLSGLCLSAALLVLGLGIAGPGAGKGGAARAAGVQEPAAIVIVRPEPRVTGPTFTLGDIAEIVSDDENLKAALEALELGRSPLPGQSRILNEPRLRVALRRARLPERAIVIQGMDGDVRILGGQERREVLVAAVDLARHQPLEPGLVTVAVEDTARLRPDALAPGDIAEDEWANWRTKRMIRAGQVLDWSHLEPRPDASRGQTVTVRVRHGAVEVTARGTLEADARLGERVPVRVEGGDRTVWGTLVAPDQVEVAVGEGGG